MRSMQLSELAQPLSAALHGADREIRGVTTDSRRVQGSDLFVALHGERFDGHDYLPQAAAAGAVGALVSREVETPLSLLKVTDTQRALGRLGAYNRSLYCGPLVAVTGSSGKTTVKNLVRSVLAQRGETLATEGNFNNEIGVPLTLLRLAPQHHFAVVEMGAARAGDVAWLCELARPSVSLLLNAMPAHLESFGSVDAIAVAKGEIFDGLGSDGVAVINADQTWAGQWRQRAAPARVIDFALQQPAAITATDIQSHGVEGISFTVHTPAGDAPVRLYLPGVHNVGNALAATAVGLACGLSLAEIVAGLAAAVPVAGRLAVNQAPAGATVVDDCYNANPGSVRAAIDILAGCGGRRTLLLGAMLELGADSAALHREIGEYARGAGIERLWGVGEELLPAVEAFGANARHFTDRAAAIAALAGAFGPDDTVLVKGSRGSAMEQVLAALLVGEG